MIPVLAVRVKSIKSAMAKMSEAEPRSNMANHIFRFRQSDKNIFDDIRSGRKAVETRAATTKFKNIKPADIVVFVCGKDRFEKEVKSAEIFKDVPSILKKYRVGDIAPRLATEGDLIKMYHSFPGYEEKIKKFGLIALRFE